MPLTEKFDVANLERWGQLVKSWATDLDYVSQPFSNQPPRKDWVKQPSKLRMALPPAQADVPVSNATWALPAMKPTTVQTSKGEPVELPYAVALTADQFTDLLKNAGIRGVVMPDRYDNVIVVQGNDKTMIVRLPPKTELQGSEDDLLNGRLYPIRPFYSAIYQPPEGAPHLPADDDQAGIMLLHANRIGEYTLNTCD